MEQSIYKLLNELENNMQIRILYACESGSRAWGTHTDDSDYDVRFIYKKNINQYLQIYEDRDVIEISIPDERIEVVGWDLKKSLKLMNKSNPSLFEWLNSPIVYQCDKSFFSELKRLGDSTFLSVPTIYHYLNMAKRNYQSMDKNNIFTTKGYLNILRPILSCHWVLEKKRSPPNNVLSLYPRYLCSQSHIGSFKHLLTAKQEKQQLFFSRALNQYIEDSLSLIEDKVRNVQERKLDVGMKEKLNKFFIDTIKE